MLQTLPREILEVVIGSASDALIVTDESRHIVYFNSEAERLFGYRGEEALGKDLHILIPDRFAGVHAHYVSEFFGGHLDRRVMSERPELVID